MPTYDYQCQKCGKTFEFFQSMKDAPLTTCPESICGESPQGQGEVKRLLGTGAGLIFKGSGFYITDYRSESYKQAAKQESAPASTSSPAKKDAGAGSSTAPASAPASGSAPKAASGASGAS